MSRVTSFGDKLLRYPADMVDQHTDYFQIEVLSLKGISGGGFEKLQGKTVLDGFDAQGPYADPNKAFKAKYKTIPPEGGGLQSLTKQATDRY